MVGTGRFGYGHFGFADSCGGIALWNSPGLYFQSGGNHIVSLNFPFARIGGGFWTQCISLADICMMSDRPQIQQVGGEWVSRADFYRKLLRVVNQSVSYLATGDADIAEWLGSNPGVNNLSDFGGRYRARMD